MLRKIVSGGQTGVDPAALDTARALGLRSGGWCPSGRIAEDDRLRLCYRLLETASPDYWQRTEWNVRDPDGTLIINRGRRIRRERFRAWLARHRVRVLNVAGPRESKRPSIYRQARRILLCLLG